MSHKPLFLSLLLALGVCGVLNAPANAQPDVNAAPKAENPPNWNWNPGGRGGARGGRMRMGFPMTAEQLKQIRTQQTEQRALNLKQQLTVAGFTDAALQTAIVDEFKAQSTAQSDLLEKWQKITAAVRVNQTPAADMTAMLVDFRAAAAKEKTRRATATADLEAKYQISQKPTLDAMLMTMGITGDEAALVGQINGGGMGQIMNLLGGLGGAGNFQVFGNRGDILAPNGLFGGEVQRPAPANRGGAVFF